MGHSRLSKKVYEFECKIQFHKLKTWKIKKCPPKILKNLILIRNRIRMFLSISNSFIFMTSIVSSCVKSDYYIQ